MTCGIIGGGTRNVSGGNVLSRGLAFVGAIVLPLCVIVGPIGIPFRPLVISLCAMVAAEGFVGYLEP